MSSMEKAAALTLLIVDDEADLREIFRTLFMREGFRVLMASSGREALEVCAKEQIDAVLTDMRMPDGDGYELLKSIKRLYPKIHSFAMTGYSDQAVDKILALGVKRVFAKPFNYSVVVKELQNCMA